MVIVTLTYFNNCLNSCNLSLICFNLVLVIIKATYKQKTICQLSDLIHNQSFPKYPSVKTCTIKKPINWFTTQILIILNQCEQSLEYSIREVLVMKHVLMWYDNDPESIFAFILRILIKLIFSDISRNFKTCHNFSKLVDHKVFSYVVAFWYINSVIWCATGNWSRALNLFLLSCWKVAKQDSWKPVTLWQISLMLNFSSVLGSASGYLKCTLFISNLVAKNPGLKLDRKLCNWGGIVNLPSPFSFPKIVTHLDTRKPFFIAKI